MARELDFIDRKILNELQRNGRCSIVELAERVNLTKTPCSERVKRLERKGVLKEYCAVLEPDKVERGFVTMVQISLAKTAEGAIDDFNRFNQEVQKLPEVQECYLIVGHFDYLIKMRTRDIAHFREVFGEKISRLPGVMQTQSFAVMETVKETTMIDMLAD